MLPSFPVESPLQRFYSTMVSLHLKALSRSALHGSFLLTMVTSSGCVPPCVGVGCEEDFGSARISLVSGVDVPESGTADPLAGQFVLTGTDALGPNWDVTVIRDRIIVGSGTDSSVRSYTPGVESALVSSSATGRIDGNRTNDQFGSQVRPIHNEDGTDDLLVSAPLLSAADATRHDGAVYRFGGLGQGFSGQRSAEDALFRLTGEWSGGRFGTTLAVCPDLDGDGLDEWVASAPRDGKEEAMAGQVVLVRSGDLEPDTTQLVVTAIETRWTGSDVGAMAGHTLRCSDDLTGDGVADLVVGSPYADGDDDTDAVGAVHVLSGVELAEQGPLNEAALFTLQPGEANDWFGWSIATGDIDGDGSTDLVVGAPGADDATGVVRIWTGASLLSSEPNEPDVSISGINPGDGFGRTVHIADVNGDGIDDLLVGAPFLNPTGLVNAFDAGRVSLFFGTVDTAEWSLRTNAITASVIYEEAEQYLRTGIALFSGDFDGDERDDIVFLQRTSED
jgi:hypothetical protein